MSEFNWVDYVFFVIIVLSMLSGFARGFVREIISFFTLIAAIVIASMFTQPLAAALTTNPTVQNMVSQSSSAIGMSTAQPVSYVAIGLSFALLFAGTVIVGSIIGYFINIAFQVGILGLGNRLLGGVFGLIRGAIITLVIIFVVQLTPFGTKPWWQQSEMVRAYQPAVAWLAELVSPGLASLKERFGQTLQNINTQVRDVTNTIGNYAR